MHCPSCGERTHVIETRETDGGAAIRRRRGCGSCGARFTTFERRDPRGLRVVKRDGSRQPFDREKLLGGLLRAAHKRPVERADAERIVDAIVAEAERAGGELAAQRVGDMALAGLREIDRIAYLQFAAVYKGFEDPSELRAELEELGIEPPDEEAGPGRRSPGGRKTRASGDDRGDGFRPGGERGSVVTAASRTEERD